MAVSADGRRAVSGGGDGTVRVWDLDTGHRLHTLTGHTAGCARWRSARTAAAPSPAASDGTVRVWDLDTGEPLHTLTGHTAG